VPQREQVLDDLPAPVGRVGHQAGQPVDAAVEQHDRRAFGQCPQLAVRQPARREQEPVDGGPEPVQVGRLHLRAALRVGDDERRAGRPRLRLGAADEAKVVRIGDVGNQHGHHSGAPRGQGLGEAVGSVAEIPGDRLHVLTRRHVDALGVRQRP
jgi:hypothetical protein